jgi:hypothetical protein
MIFGTDLVLDLPTFSTSKNKTLFFKTPKFPLIPYNSRNPKISNF